MKVFQIDYIYSVNQKESFDRISEIMKWCNDNLKTHSWEQSTPGVFKLHIENENEIMLFKLSWGNEDE